MKDRVLEHINLMDLLAAKRFPNSSLADEAMLFVLEKLEENNWQRVRTFSGRSRFSTFIAVVTKRLLEDFSRKKFGRVRPPVWLKRIGGFWLQVFKHLCLERLSFTETIETLVLTVPDRSRKEVEEAAQTILEKITDCGNYHGAEYYSEDDEIERAAHRHTGNSSIEDKLLDKDRENIFKIVFRDMLNDPHLTDSSELFHNLSLEINVDLNSEERLLLKLRFVEGMSVTAAGKMLGFADHQARKMLRLILDRLRQTFEQADVDDRIKAFLHP